MKTIKLIILVLVGTLLLGGCQQTCDKEQSLSDVQLLLEKYIIANETKNIELIKEIWAPDDNIMIFGTESDEKLVGWKQIQNTFIRQFESFEETYISVTDQNISLNCNNNIAWFSEILNYNYTLDGQAKRFEGLRFTGVIEKRGEKWHIVQSHMSVPYNEMEHNK
ncbi:MAG: nuclear transport factor 2 family protein [Bacteroidota bacterium]|nr:nuclear transport factor 2 family protein [Bacteroidota bacterium]